MNKLFETWHHGGRQYLAVDNGNGGISIVDAAGRNYGAWRDTESFRRHQRADDGFITDLGGRIQVRVLIAGTRRGNLR